MGKKQSKQTEIKDVIEEVKPQEIDVKETTTPIPKPRPVLRCDLGTVHVSAWLNPNTKTGGEWINIKLVVDYKSNPEDKEFQHQIISMNINQLNKTLDALTSIKLGLLKDYSNLIK